MRDALEQLRGRFGRGNLLGDLKVAEFRPRLAELGQANLARRETGVAGVHGEVIVDIATDAVLLQADLECIPFPRPIVRARLLTEDGPGKDIGPLKTGQPQLPDTRIEAIVLVAAIGLKDQPGSARFI